MKSKYKRLITDIMRDAAPEKNIQEYVFGLSGEYNYYATVKMSLNYYTMKENILELEDKRTDVCKYFELITKLIKDYVINRNVVTKEAMECINTLRSNVEYKMKILTAFTDGYEVYEYLLNRQEDGIKGTVVPVNTELLTDKMFAYVFSENDTVLINSKIQLFMAQLPVRMTRMKFYDIVSKTLNIYENTEKNSVDEFVDMLKSAVLIDVPKGFETEYPFLYRVYQDLSLANYKELNEETFDKLKSELFEAAKIIDSEVSSYMLMQEIINDVYTILLTVDASYEGNKDSAGYKAALTILTGCVNRDDLDELTSELINEFLNIEGVQENVYENIIILEAALQDIKTTKMEQIEEFNMKEPFLNLSTVSKLLSTSLFIDLSKDYDGTSLEIANHEYIVAKNDELIEAFDSLFKDKQKEVVRSMMCKLLAVMPIFMNTKQEIKDYFQSSLDKCKDESELSACYKLITDIMEEE